MATINEAKQQIIDLAASHDGGQRLDEGDDSYTQLGVNDLGRGYKAFVEAEKIAADAGLSTSESTDISDSVEFIC